MTRLERKSITYLPLKPYSEASTGYLRSHTAPAEFGRASIKLHLITFLYLNRIPEDWTWKDPCSKAFLLTMKSWKSTDIISNPWSIQLFEYLSEDDVGFFSYFKDKQALRNSLCISRKVWTYRIMEQGQDADEVNQSPRGSDTMGHMMPTLHWHE